MLDDTLEQVIDVINELKVGKFKAIVLSNENTENPGWLELQPISQDANTTTNSFWAEPCVPFAGPSSHAYWLPDVGATVWYEHAGGRLNNRIWTGCCWPEENSGLDEADLKPSKKLLRFGDIEILVDEDEGTLTLKCGDSTKLIMTSDTIQMEAANIIQSAQGNDVKVSASGFDALGGALKVV